MSKTLTYNCDGESLEVKQPITPRDLRDAFDLPQNLDNPVLGASLNNRLVSMNQCLVEGGNIEFIRYQDSYGHKYYKRGLSLLVCQAITNAGLINRLWMSHSLEHGFYYWIQDRDFLQESLLEDLRHSIEASITESIPFEHRRVSQSEAIEYFRDAGQDDKVRLLEEWNPGTVELHTVGDYTDLAHTPAPSTSSVIQEFSLRSHRPGFIARFPTKHHIDRLPDPDPQPQLFNIYQEDKEWAKILNVHDIGALNRTISGGNIGEFIKISEALHEKKISQIADRVEDRIKRTDLICVAGPSSSGKTTFSRLGVQLRVHGIRPLTLSADDYFVDRSETPLDAEGNYDFESPGALDLELLNRHLKQLSEDKPVEVPKFSFSESRRVGYRDPISPDEHDVVILEGLHGLNPQLTRAIERHRKFLIYVSHLTQLNRDNHNRISTSDSRLIRRIVRDVEFRDIDPVTNIDRWNRVRRGEQKYIFPHQNRADVMFNSALLYELAVLKPHLIEALETVDHGRKEYREVHQLLRFVDTIHSVSDEEVPHTSILREFIGGSSFSY
ncbi:MAG: nucleoside kinase [bacterium]